MPAQQDGGRGAGERGRGELSRERLVNQATVDGKVLGRSQQSAALTGGSVEHACRCMSGFARSNEGRALHFTDASNLASIPGDRSRRVQRCCRQDCPPKALATYSLQAYGHARPRRPRRRVGDFAFACSARRAESARWPTLRAGLRVRVRRRRTATAVGARSRLGSLLSAEDRFVPPAPARTGASKRWDAAGDSLDAVAGDAASYWAQFARSGNSERRQRAEPGPRSRRLPATTSSCCVPPAPRQDTGFATRHQCAFWG